MLALMWVVLSSGCAARAPTPATVLQINPKGCDAQWDLGTPPLIEIDSPQGAQAFRVDGNLRCLAQTDDGSVSYAVYRLPRFVEPWTLRVESRISEGKLFAPAGLLLDADAKVTRQIPFDRFAMRGERLRTTVFFAPDNANEEYLLIHSAGAVVGRSERHIVSGSFVIPLIAGVLPFLYMQGTESEGSFTYAHDGVVYLRARTESYSALRRKAPARATGISERGVVTR
ncbi:MAG: MalM family protein [Panacagrimonas sp.]